MVKKPTWRGVFSQVYLPHAVVNFDIYTQELSGSLLLFYLFFPAAEVAAKYTRAIWLYGAICIIAV